MIMRFKNKTDQIQQINFIDGSGLKVGPRTPQGGFADINITTLYKEELERAKRFFTITPVPENKNFSDKIKFTKVNKYRR